MRGRDRHPRADGAAAVPYAGCGGGGGTRVPEHSRRPRRRERRDVPPPERRRARARGQATGLHLLLQWKSGRGTLLPYLMLDRGLDEEAAVAQALRVGLRSAELMEQALEYVR